MPAQVLLVIIDKSLDDPLVRQFQVDDWSFEEDIQPVEAEVDFGREYVYGSGDRDYTFRGTKHRER